LIAHLLAAWRSLRWRELLAFALTWLAFAAIDLNALVEVEAGNLLPQVVLRTICGPLLGSLILLAFWLPAERSDPSHPLRTLRLALALLLGAALATVAINTLMPLLPWPSVYDVLRAHKGMPPMSKLHWSGLLGETLAVLMPAGLLMATFELRQRSRRSERAALDLLAEHGQLRRRALAAQLATLQAQVEPELLFDALVEIERSYGQGSPEAAPRMERLIRHLRVALPRLRDAGSTLEIEAELLGSYLAVLEDVQQRPLHFVANWPEGMGAASLPPMLLLPLLQRALRIAGTPPKQCTLNAEAMAGGLRIRLGFDRAGLCGDDAELQALAERLRMLSGGTARLRCDGGPDTTLFTLELD